MSINFKITISVIFIILAAISLKAYERDEPLIIDHTCSVISAIPLNWIDSVQQNILLHYAHTSHGSQLVYGLDTLYKKDQTYLYDLTYNSLPYTAGALCIFGGQEDESYVTTELYWETKDGMNRTRNVLNNNPSIKISMWAWCVELNTYGEEQVQAYLDSMAVLETEFPDVLFIYMTGNAQEGSSLGYNRYLRNEQIRNYCITNNKILFDFADLDSWWLNPDTEEWESSTYTYYETTYMVEHPEFRNDVVGHTTYESCEQKAKALWWMLARLAGWSGDTSATGDNDFEIKDFELYQNYPNPFNPETTIDYNLAQASKVKLSIYNSMGQKIITLINQKEFSGYHSVKWSGLDQKGNPVPTGVYIYSLQINDNSKTKKMLFLK